MGDVVRRRVREGRLPDPQTVPDEVREVQEELAALRQGPAVPRVDRPARPLAERVHGGLAVAAVAGTAMTVSTVWAAQDLGGRVLRGAARSTSGSGKAAWAVAILGWDFIYYWNHRFSHESRWMWAVHVAHHSSERYNLSTALRQPVAESITIAMPYSLLALLGVRPALIEQARGLNLIYQFWIHTEAIRTIGWLERVLNTPSHHRVHHGSNRQLPRPQPRQHPDRLGPAVRHLRAGGRARSSTASPGTSTPTTRPGSPPTSSSTSRATCPRAESWPDRLSYLLRGPGWAYQRAGVA